MSQQDVLLQSSTLREEPPVTLTPREIQKGWVVEQVGDRRMKLLSADYLRYLRTCGIGILQ